MSARADLPGAARRELGEGCPADAARDRLLLDNGLLDPGRFLAASAPTLMYPRKNIVVAQLKLIDRVIRTHPATQEAALAMAAQAFAHERADVQEAALKLIAGMACPAGTPGLRSAASPGRSPPA
jgi:hypothetical protein